MIAKTSERLPTMTGVFLADGQPPDQSSCLRTPAARVAALPV